jgi:hypothetical protein
MPRRRRPATPHNVETAIDELIWRLDEEAEKNQLMADYLHDKSKSEAAKYAMQAKALYVVIEIVDDHLTREEPK